MSYPYLIQGSNITIVIKNKPHTISKTHPTYEKVKQAIKDGKWDVVENIIDPKQMVLNYGSGHLSIKGEKMYWKGTEFHNAMSKRMFAMLQEDFPIEPLVLFMENLMQNPSYRAVNELFGFLEKNSLPITPDGHFLAYKKVRGDFKDIHSGTFDNSVGAVCEMERNAVDDNKEQTCSAGLHFCSEQYLPNFGSGRHSDDHVMILKINPRDVVSIPVDYNNSKGRCCRYEVIGEVGLDAEDSTEFTAPVQSNANSVKVKEPKVGSGEYVRGYENGYNGDGSFNQNGTDNYDEGYTDGKFDRNNGCPRAYKFVAAPSFRSAETLARNLGSQYGWPQPK